MKHMTRILGFATLVFGSASAYLYNDLTATREQSALLQTRIEQLERHTGSSPSRSGQRRSLPANPFSPAEKDSDPASARVTPPPVAPPAATPPPAAVLAASGPVTTMTARGMWDRSRKLLEDPEYRDAMKRQQKMMMPQRYPDLQAALQLSEQQTDQLFDVLAEQQIRSATLRPPLTAAGERPDEATMRDWLAQQQRLQSATETELAAVLGDTKAQQWKTYQSTLPARSQVKELRATLESAGLTLQPDQTEKLVAAMSAEQQKAVAEIQNGSNFPSMMRTQPDRTAMFERQIDLTRQQQQRIRAAAGPYLSAEQMHYLERMQASQLEMQQINLRMMRAQSEAEARGDLPPANQATGFIADR